MKKQWLIATGLVALLVLGGVTAAFGRFGHPRGFGFHGERAMAQLEARLKMTPDQSSKMREIVSTQKSKLFDQFGAGRDNRQALIKEIFKDNPSQAEIQKRVEALKQQHAQMLDQLVAAGLEVNKIFTPEQRTELQKAIDEKFQVAAKMRERMRERMAERSRPEAAPQPESKPK